MQIQSAQPRANSDGAPRSPYPSVRGGVRCRTAKSVRWAGAQACRAWTSAAAGAVTESWRAGRLPTAVPCVTRPPGPWPDEPTRRHDEELREAEEAPEEAGAEDAQAAAKRETRGPEEIRVVSGQAT